MLGSAGTARGIDRGALLCPPDSVPDWERALIRLRDDRRLRERLGATARDDFESRYTWRQRAAHILECVTRPAAG
jgi:glycosyltransferase involved in cell wall biosynthesis